MNTFTTITDQTISDLIDQARWRVIYVSPGISVNVAKALIKFISKNGYEQLDVVLDPNPEVCRLGYGEIEALDLLFNRDILIRECKGIKIGVIITDDKAYIYTPTPLVVEEEPDFFAPNAIIVKTEQAKRLVHSIIPPKEKIIDKSPNKQLALFEDKESDLTPEIGATNITRKELEIAKNDLKICPPQKFDLARRVNVYHSYVQFIELKLVGCNIERRTIAIPAKLLNLVKSSEDKERLKATYKLFGEKSKVTGKAIDEKVNSIRKKYIRSLGQRFGNVILRNKKEEFLKEVAALNKELEKFKCQVEAKLKTEFDKSEKELIQILLPGIIKNPPDDLIGGILTIKPTSAQAMSYIAKVLESAIPDVKTFIEDMKLQIDFKDVTYEMLNDSDFIDGLKKVYPLVNWPKPFEEYQAAKEVDAI